MADELPSSADEEPASLKDDFAEIPFLTKKALDDLEELLVGCYRKFWRAGSGKGSKIPFSVKLLLEGLDLPSVPAKEALVELEDHDFDEPPVPSKKELVELEDNDFDKVPIQSDFC